MLLGIVDRLIKSGDSALVLQAYLSLPANSA